MKVANKVTNAETGFLRGKKILLLDLDTKFTLKFREHLKAPGTEPIRLPPKSPNCNAFIERFFRSIKTECLRSEIPNQLWKSKLTLRAPSLESAYSRNHFLSQKCCVPFLLPFLLFHDSAFAFSGLIDKVREDFS